jgi:phage-related protein
MNRDVNIEEIKPVEWLGSTLDDLRVLPDPVQDDFGYALYLAQTGDKHPRAKPLRGHHGAGVLEVVAQHDSQAYRAIYTVRFQEAVYVLHVFQKKSKSGIATPAGEMRVVEARLKEALRRHSEKEEERTV